jgi:tetratricopeptide (TPR) repeat protein
MKKKIGISILILAILGAFAYGLRPRRTVTTFSDEAYGEYSRGVELYKKFYFEESLTHFQRAVKLDTGFAMAYCYQGLVHRGYGRIEEAQRAFTKAMKLALKATEKERLIIAFQNAHMNWEYDQADEIIHTLSQKYPKAIEPYDYRGNEYFRRRDFEKCITEYNRIVEIDPNYALAYNQLGYAHAFLRNFDEAIANLKKYVFLAPDQPNPHDSLGEIYLIMGEYDEAITEFNKARELKLDFTFAIDHLGTAYRHKGMYRKAISYFEKSLALCTTQWCRANKSIEIARINHEKGDFDTAVTLLEQTTAQAPQLYVLKWLMGLNYTAQGKITNAVSQRKQMEDLLAGINSQEEMNGPRPEIGEEWLRKALLHLSGHIELASNAYDKAIEDFNSIFSFILRPEEEIFFRTSLAEAMFQSGEFESAIKELENVFHINPNYAPSRYLLAHIYHEQGDLHKEIIEIEKYLFIMDGCDEDVPKIQEMRERYNRLKEMT